MKILSSTWTKFHIGIPALDLPAYRIVVVVALLTSAYPALAKFSITLVPLIEVIAGSCKILRLRLKLPDVTVIVA